MNFFKRSRTFVTLVIAAVLHVVALERILLSEPGIVANFINSTSITFFMERACTKTKYDIITLGNSRSYMNIDYTITEAYLPDNCNIFNFGFGGHSFCSPQILRSASSFLKKKGKRVFCLFLSNQMGASNKLPHQELLRVYRFFPKKFFDYYCFISETSLVRGRRYSTKRLIPHTSWIEYNSKLIKENFAPNTHWDVDFQALEKSISFCKKNSIKVVALHAPTATVSFEFEETEYKKHKIEEFLVTRGVLFLHVSGRDLNFETYDKTHLTRASGRRFAHWLGQELSKLEWFK